MTYDMIRRARLATSEADDLLLVALVTSGVRHERTIDAAIENLEAAAEVLGYALVHKDDGK